MKRQPILVVDEDVRVQRLLARVLRGARYEVAIAASAREALAVLATRRFGVVVSDLQMPDIDGIELLREIRRRDIDVPIVFVTDTPDAQRADSTFETGAVRYMAKPVDASLFLAAVTRAETLSRLARIQGPLGTTRAARRATGDDGKLERRFEAACARLWMAYQPIVSQRSGTVVAFEALLRSDEPSLASPAAFIGAGERLGRLESIGRRVRAAAAAAISELPADVELFVNLHPFDLTDRELAMPDSPLSKVASRVVLEITERASLERVGDAKAKIAALRSLGFRIAIDDLGAGYAGLSWLATVEPDVVKIDMGLIRGIDVDVKRQQVVFCLIGLCEKLDVRVVVEGVETEAERATLVELGADSLQGYLFGRPERQFGGSLAIRAAKLARPQGVPVAGVADCGLECNCGSLHERLAG